MAESLEATIQLINAVFGEDGGATIPPVAAADQLSSGFHFYALLARTAPHAFTNLDAIKVDANGWIIKKSNLQKLCAAITSYARLYMKASADFNTEDVVDITTISKTGSVAELEKLASLVVAEVALSSNVGVLQHLRGLPKPSQTCLSNLVRGVRGKYGLQKASEEPTATPRASNTGSEAAAFGSPAAASGTMTPTSTPTSANVRVYDEASNESPVVLRAEIAQLRERVAQLTSEADVARSRADLAEKQCSEVTAKYRNLLEETAAKGASTKEREWAAAVEQRDEKIKTLTASVTALSSKCDSYKKTIEEAEDRAAAQLAEVEKLQQQLRTKSQEKDDLQQRLAIQQDASEMNVKAREKVEKERDEFEAELKRLRAQLSSSSNNGRGRRTPMPQDEDEEDGDDEAGGGKCKRLRKEVERLNKELSASQLRISLLSQAGRSNDESQLSETVYDLREELRIQRERADAKELEVETLRAAVEEMEKTRAAVTADANATLHSELSEKLAAAERRAEQLTARLASVEEQLAKERSALLASEAAQSKISSEAFTLRSEVDSLRNHHIVAITRIAELEQQLAKAEELATNGGIGQQQGLEELDKLRRENQNLQARFEIARNASKAEQALLISYVVDVGQRNLLLQQTHMLNRNSINSLTSKFCDDEDDLEAAAAAAGAENSGGGGGYYSDTTFLAKNRRRAERGLLERLAGSANSPQRRK